MGRRPHNSILLPLAIDTNCVCALRIRLNSSVLWCGDGGRRCVVLLRQARPYNKINLIFVCQAHIILLISIVLLNVRNHLFIFILYIKMYFFRKTHVSPVFVWRSASLFFLLISFALFLNSLCGFVTAIGFLNSLCYAHTHTHQRGLIVMMPISAEV